MGTSNGATFNSCEIQTLNVKLRRGHYKIGEAISERNTAELGVQDAYIFSDFIRIFFLYAYIEYLYICAIKKYFVISIVAFFLWGSGLMDITVIDLFYDYLKGAVALYN